MRLASMMLLFAMTAAIASGQEPSSTPAALPPENAPLNDPTYFGINGIGFFHRPNETEELERRWELMRELGVRWDRSDLWWSDLEKRPGQWDFSKADAAMRVYREHGVQMLPILDYGAAWRDTRAPANDEQRREWAGYVSRVVGRYKGYASYWEVWNEPNIIPFWRPQPNVEDYAKLLKLTAERAREANPNVHPVGFVCADLDLPFIERTMELDGTGDFDAASYHFYRITQPERRTPQEIAEYRLALEHFGKHCPIWVSEMGVTSFFKEGVSEELQATYLMRQILLLVGSGVERIFPFCLVDNPGDPGGEWGTKLGLVTLEWRKKPAFYAYKTLLRELNDWQLVGPVSLKENVQGYLYELRPQKAQNAAVRQKLVAWSTCDAQDIKYFVDEDAAASPTAKDPEWQRVPEQFADSLTSYTTLLGEARPIQYQGNVARVPLGPAPVYVPVKSRWLYENAKSGWARGEILSSPGHSETTTLTLAMAEAPWSAVRFQLPEGWTGQLKGENYRFTVPAQAKPGWYTLSAQIPATSGTLTKELRVWVRPELRVSVRPFFTTQSAEIVTSFTLHNQNLSQPVKWRFELAPPAPGISFPQGTLGEQGGYFAQNVASFPKKELLGLTDTSRIKLRYEAGTDKDEAKSSATVYRIALTPLVEKAPQVDGELSEYENAPWMHLGEKEQLLRGEPQGEADASAKVAAFWTHEGLYVAADIRDDFPMMNDRRPDQDVYEGDALELYVGPSGYSGQYYAKAEEGAYHYFLSPGKAGVGGFVSDSKQVVAGSRLSARATPGGYAMEAFIPKSAFGGYEPTRGDVIAWDVQLDDSDSYTPGAKKGSSYMWNGDDMNWLKAEKWGAAVVK